jgi:C4-dicarboxylate-specific signal transduction histidine kinase
LGRTVPHGKIVKWYGTSTDIDDRQRAELLQTELAHVNRVSTMGELSASLAHEIKQPIAAAVTNAQTCLLWLERDQPDLDEIRAAAERIVQDGTRAGEIIGRLRELYKKSPPQRELVDIGEIVREMVRLLRGEANRYAVSIGTDLATDFLRLW